MPDSRSHDRRAGRHRLPWRLERHPGDPERALQPNLKSICFCVAAMDKDFCGAAGDGDKGVLDALSVF